MVKNSTVLIKTIYDESNQIIEEGDEINKFIVVEVDDTITDIYIEKNKREYVDCEVEPSELNKNILNMLIIHFCFIEDDKISPFGRKISYTHDINYKSSEYTVKVSKEENTDLREEIGKDVEIIISILLHNKIKC